MVLFALLLDYSSHFHLRVQRKLSENSLSQLLILLTEEHKPDKKET